MSSATRQPNDASPQTLRSARTWAELLRLCQGPEAASGSQDPRRAAETLSRRPASSDGDRALGHALRRVLVDLQMEGDAARPVAREVESFILALTTEGRRRLLDQGGEQGHRRAVAVSAADVLAPRPALFVLGAAAAAAGRPFTPALRSVLEKLATHAESAPSPLQVRAEAAVRQELENTVGRLWPVHTGPMAFGQNDMFQEEAVAGRATAPGAHRLVQMSLELDALGTPTWGPVTQLMREGRFRDLVGMFKAVSPDSRAARTIAAHVVTPERLRELLADERVDWEVVDRFLEHMGPPGIEAVLDELLESESRATRRALFDRLKAAGPVVRPFIPARLQDKRWYVLRNLVALLGEIGYWPPSVSVDRFLGHEDPRVRREALRTMLRLPGQREQGVLAILRETDAQALQGLTGVELPAASESLVPHVVRRISEPNVPSEVKAHAVKLLRASRSALALSALLQLTDGGRNLLGRLRLPERSPELLAALRVLANVWPHDRRAAAVLERARASKDPEIAGAAHAGEEG